ncbi:hypothetical protein AB7194_11105 [Providencia stuartii]|uniref:hypothetical protein n=1 Tax=Providencia stuartii TaxID=588 RepID=UPI0034E59327
MIGLSPIEQMPVIMLLVTIAVLFAISYLVTDASLKGTREVSFEIKSDSLDKQYLFWLGIIVPIGIFFYLEYFVFLSNEISFNSTGFKAFFDESKLPLGVLALSPIFGVIVSNIHRTIQTEKQIAVTERKNIADSFYSHNKYIVEEFKLIKEESVAFDIAFQISFPNKLYKIIYKESSIKDGGNEDVSYFFVSRINSYFLFINKELLVVEDLVKNIDSYSFGEFNRNLTKAFFELDKKIKNILSYNQTKTIGNPILEYLKKSTLDLENEIKGYNKNNESIKSLLNEYRKYHLSRKGLNYIIIYTQSVLKLIDKVFDTINVEQTKEELNCMVTLSTKLMKLRTQVHQKENKLEKSMDDYLSDF